MGRRSQNPTFRAVVAVAPVSLQSNQLPATPAILRHVRSLLAAAFRAADVHWEKYIRRSDDSAVVIVLPVDASIVPVLDPLPRYLASLLEQRSAEGIALVLAMDAGIAHQTDDGYAGTPVDNAMRLLHLAADEYRAGAGSNLLVVLTDRLYQDVVPHGYQQLSEHSYRRTSEGWMQEPRPAVLPRHVLRPPHRQAIGGAATVVLVLALVVALTVWPGWHQRAPEVAAPTPHPAVVRSVGSPSPSQPLGRSSTASGGRSATPTPRVAHSRTPQASISTSAAWKLPFGPDAACTPLIPDGDDEVADEVRDLRQATYQECVALGSHGYPAMTGATTVSGYRPAGDVTYWIEGDETGYLKVRISGPADGDGHWYASWQQNATSDCWYELVVIDPSGTTQIDKQGTGCRRPLP